MRIQVRQGSEAEQLYYRNSSLPKGGWPKPEVIAPGISPKPLEDLLFHGGKIVPQMEFQNVYLGGEASWQPSDIESIDLAIAMAMQDRRLNNVIKQYFVDLPNLTCDPRHSILLAEAKPEALDEPDVQAAAVRLYREKKISTSNLDGVIFNLLLPAGSVLKLGESNSLRGLTTGRCILKITASRSRSITRPMSSRSLWRTAARTASPCSMPRGRTWLPPCTTR